MVNVRGFLPLKHVGSCRAPQVLLGPSLIYDVRLPGRVLQVVPTLGLPAMWAIGRSDQPFAPLTDHMLERVELSDNLPELFACSLRIPEVREEPFLNCAYVLSLKPDVRGSHDG